MVSSVATATSSTNHLLRPPPPSTSTSSPSLSFLRRPLCISSTTTTPILSKLKSQQKPLYTHLKSLSTFCLSNRKNLIFCHSLSLSTQANPIDDETHLDDEETEVEEEEVDGIDEEKVIEVKSEILKVKRIEKLPDLNLNLTVKEKKELSSYANSLGKKLKSQLVGKSGVTENVATSFVETLESNELLKIKIHRSCPGELDDAVSLLEKLTGSIVVGKIGRTVILYRPSITKLKAEEKKEQNRKLLLSRRSRPFVPRGQERKPFKSGTGRHGSSFSLEKGQERKPFKSGTGRRGSSFSLQRGQERTPFKSGRRGLSKV